MVDRYFSKEVKKDGEWTDEFGNPYSLSEDVIKSLRPIFVGTMIDLLKDDPNALDGLLLTMAFFGIGVNIQEEKQPKEKSKKTIPSTW